MIKVVTPYLKELNESDALPENYACLIIECKTGKDGESIDYSVAKLGETSLISEAMLNSILEGGNNITGDIFLKISELIDNMNKEKNTTQKEEQSNETNLEKANN